MEVQRRLVHAILMLTALAAVATCGYKLLGQDVTWLDAVYMTVISLSTVGYGEIVNTDHSPGLRILNMLVVICGVGFMAYVFSLATAFVVEGELKNVFWRRKMQKRIGDLRGHIIVCGSDETGMHVVEELRKTGHEVVVVDQDLQRLENSGRLTDVPRVQGDVTDEEVLEQAGLSRASGVITVLPSDKDNLVVTVTVRQRCPGIRIVSHSMEAKMGERILKAGANSIVSPSFIGGLRLASEMIRPHVVSFLDLMLREESKTLRIEEVLVPDHSSWAGMQLGHLKLRQAFHLSCLALRRRGDKSYRYNPSDDEVVDGSSVLVVMGDVERIRGAREAAATTPHSGH